MKMSKKKLRQGVMITSLDQLSRCEWIIIHHKPYHRGWVASWCIRMAKGYVDSGRAYEGIRLTNGQYYPNLTNEQIKSRFDCDLQKYSPCDKCELRDECKEPHCWKAIAAWKEADVK